MCSEGVSTNNPDYVEYFTWYSGKDKIVKTQKEKVSRPTPPDDFFTEGFGGQEGVSPFGVLTEAEKGGSGNSLREVIRVSFVLIGRRDGLPLESTQGLRPRLNEFTTQRGQ